MKTLAFLCHPYHRGGVTTWMVNAAIEAHIQGVITYFITVDPIKPFISGGDRPTMASLFKNQTNVEVVTKKVGYQFELGSPLYRASLYASLIKNNVPLGTPIIISDDEAVWYGASQCALDYPIIGVLHSDDAHYYKLALDYQPYVSKFVAVSQRIVKTLEKKDFNAPIAVIPCGITLQNQVQKHTKNDILQIVWVGRVEEKQKRVSDIPLIAQELKSRNINFEIHVLGHGSESTWLLQQINNHNLIHQVKMHGWLDSTTINEFYAKADVLLQTSNFEGMSVAVMEAVSHGCAVVSSRVSGVEDLEYHPHAGGCIRLYEIGNIKEAVDKMLEIKNISPADRVNSALKLATLEFSIATCLNRYLSLKLNKSQKQKPYLSSMKQFESMILSTLRLIKFQIINWKKLIQK